MSQDADNTAIALAVAQNLLQGAARAIELVNRARAENRPVTDAEIDALADEDDQEQLRLEESIKARLPQG